MTRITAACPADLTDDAKPQAAPGAITIVGGMSGPEALAGSGDGGAGMSDLAVMR